MKWYKNMPEQQKKDFNKVIAVCLAGTAAVLLVPVIFSVIF